LGVKMDIDSTNPSVVNSPKRNREDEEEPSVGDEDGVKRRKLGDGGKMSVDEESTPVVKDESMKVD